MSDELPWVVKHVEEHNISTQEWVHGNIVKLEQLIYNYEMMNEEDITLQTLIHELKRSQRYMEEIIDLINFRRPTNK